MRENLTNYSTPHTPTTIPKSWEGRWGRYFEVAGRCACHVIWIPHMDNFLSPKTQMTTFPYQYAPMPTTHTALPGIDEPLTTTTTNTTTSPSTNTEADISSNVSNLIGSVKNFNTTILMMIGGSIVILFIIFK